jgi:hypothetical protein
VVDLVRLEMGLPVYSGTSRLPLINPLIIIVRDFLKDTRGENPVQSSEGLNEQIFGLGFSKKEFDS